MLHAIDLQTLRFCCRLNITISVRKKKDKYLIQLIKYVTALPII